MINHINKILERIGSAEESVRSYINTTRYQTDLLKNLDNWNQICSSLDTIGDTIFSIEDYLSSEYPENTGLKYIFTYGILQSLFIQQDAVKNLAEAFELDITLSDKLRDIRLLRNASIGHPTKNKVKKVIYFNYISRPTLSKNGFTLLRSSQGNRDEFIDVNITSIITDQLTEIEKSYELIASKLEVADKLHREKYKNQLVADIFHSSIGYLFSKVSEAINSSSQNQSFGLSMLQSIDKMYKEFESTLKARNELNEYLEYDLKEYQYAINELDSYLSGEHDNMTEISARIYLFYIREQHLHFVEIANEIDEEYNKKV